VCAPQSAQYVMFTFFFQASVRHRYLHSFPTRRSSDLEVFDLIERNAAHDAVAERLNFHTRFDDGLDVNPIGGAAVEFVDDDVLCDVDKPASQVAGVGGLQSRVGKTFPRAVRGDEVFQHGEAFSEVGSDGRLDDFAGGLGHQAAHSGELADLLFRTASAGVGHDIDRVDA